MRIQWLLLLFVTVIVRVQSASDGKPATTNAIHYEDQELLILPTDNRSSPAESDGSGGMPEEADNVTTHSKSWPYWIDTGCAQWLPVNHVYFQLANTFLFLSYLAPAGLYGLLYLRLMLAIGCAFFAIWGWIILCAFDTFLWYD